MAHKALTRRTFIGCAAIAGSTALIANPIEAYAVTAAQKQAEAQTALTKLNALQADLNKASENLDAAEQAQAEAKAKMSEAQTRIEEATGKISDLQDRLGVRAKSMYRSGSLSFLDLLMGATSFQAFSNNWEILNDMNQTDADLVQETKDLRTEVQEQKQVYAQEEARAQEEAAKAAEEKKQAEVLVAEVQSTYNSLSAEAAALVLAEQTAQDETNETTPANPKSKPKDKNSNGNSSSGSKGSGGTAPAYSGANEAVRRAYGQLGVPYVSKGATAGVGWDCSGLVSYCLTGRNGRTLGNSSVLSGYPQVSDPQPGDICYRPGHVGLYIGGGQMIHAPEPGKVVTVANCSGNMTYHRYTG